MFHDDQEDETPEHFVCVSCGREVFGVPYGRGRCERCTNRRVWWMLAACCLGVIALWFANGSWRWH